MLVETVEQFPQFIGLDKIIFEENRSEFLLASLLLENEHLEPVFAEHPQSDGGLAEGTARLFIMQYGGDILFIENSQVMSEFPYSGASDPLPGKDSGNGSPIDQPGVIKKVAEEQVPAGKGAAVILFGIGKASIAARMAGEIYRLDCLPSI